MIVAPGSVADLERLGRAFLSFVELNYVVLGHGESVFDAKWNDDRERAIASFTRYVYDNSEDEVLLRDTLAFLLNLGEDDFEPMAWAAEPPFPRRDTVDLRRFLGQLWERTWADPRIVEFDADDFEVRGAPA